MSEEDLTRSRQISNKVQEIAPGVFMEKYQIKDDTDGNHYYCIKLTLKLFKELDFTVDFTGSKNIEVIDGTSLIKKTIIQPFETLLVAKMLLKEHWNIKTKFKFTLKLPSLTIQEEYLIKYETQITEEIKTTKELSKIDFVHLSEYNIFQFLKSKNWHFIDHEFPPNFTSIDKDIETIKDKYESLIQWRRIAEIFQTKTEHLKKKVNPYVFHNGIEPNDVKQGKLGDCWILSAISALAEHPNLVKRIILTHETNEYGIYKVKLRKMSRWKTIVLDDYFPCVPNDEPIFSKNKGDELWVLLLEKAFAKMFGQYSRLVEGNPKHALIDLTGCPTFTFNLNDEASKKLVLTGVMWKLLKKWDKRKYLTAVGTKEMPSENSLAGLVKEHAYSIIRVEEVEGNKLLELRNPWGVFEWSGDWSTDSDKWTQSMRDMLNPVFEDDGCFWISYKHFLENFERINVCKTKKWQELTIKGKFINGKDSKYDFNHFSTRWYYRLEVPQKMMVILGIHQEDERFEGVKETRPYIDIGLAILKFEDGKFKIIRYLDSQFEREVYLDIILDKGEYFIVPKSMGVCLKFLTDDPITVNDYTSKNPLMLSVMKDIFQKYDMRSYETLSYEEFAAFYKYIEKDLTKTKFREILTFYKRENEDTLTENDFLHHFNEILKNSENDYIKRILKNLGYSENLFSFRTRVFALTLHSDKKIKVTVEDGFKNCIDIIVNKLLIKRYGKNIDESSDTNTSEVQGFYYFNKKIHCYSYGIYNRTDKSIKATLDLSKSENLICNLDGNIITKYIDGNTIEFFVHSQCLRDVEEYYRSALLSWE